MEILPYGSVTLITWHTLLAKVDTNFTDKRRSLGIFHSRTQDTVISFNFFSTRVFYLLLPEEMR
jgi:hypothetical protein